MQYLNHITKRLTCKIMKAPVHITFYLCIKCCTGLNVQSKLFPDFILGYCSFISFYFVSLTPGTMKINNTVSESEDNVTMVAYRVAQKECNTYDH